MWRNVLEICLLQIDAQFIQFFSLSYDRSIASSKASYP
jgi:hypothetical protein